MAVLVDTRTLPREQRADALRAVVSSTDVPHLVLPDTRCEVRIALSHRQVAPGLIAFGARADTGLELTRTIRHTRSAAPERVIFALVDGSGQHFLEAGGTQRRFTHGDLFAVDQSLPFRSGWVGPTRTESIHIDWETLGLPRDSIRTALPYLHHSPLYDLARHYLRDLLSFEDAHAGGIARAQLGRATKDILRALVVGVAPEGVRARSARTETLPSRILAYLELHFRDPHLTPAVVAAAHHVSLRQLYLVWRSVSEDSLGQWIISRRLTEARDLLARPTPPGTIEQVAHHVGFVNSTHFSRCFRQAYGLSPREWRRATRPAGARA